MKLWTNVFAKALLTVVSTWGLSGCYKAEPAATKVEPGKKEAGKDDEHAKHAEAKKAGHKEEEHGKHPEHKKDGHKKGEHKDHKHGDHHDKALTGGIKVGDKVPDFSIKTLDGKSVKLSEMQKDAERTKKGVVVLSFWCTTCHSCRDVEGHLAKMAKDYAGQAAVIALDANADDTAQRVAAFVKKKGLTVPVILDPTGHTADVLGIKVTTTTVIIDGNGVLRYCGQLTRKAGASAEEALKAVLAGDEVSVKTTPHNG